MPLVLNLTSNCISRISFGSVPACRDSKNGEANFLKEAKAAALQLRSPAG